MSEWLCVGPALNRHLYGSKNVILFDISITFVRFSTPVWIVSVILLLSYCYSSQNIQRNTCLHYIIRASIEDNLQQRLP